MVVAPVLFVCKLLQSEHEILMLADNVVGLLEINAKFPIKYFHIAAPMSQQFINLDNDSLFKMSCWINLYLFCATVCLIQASREHISMKVNYPLNISEHDDFPLPGDA